MEVTLRLPGGTVISSHAMKNKTASADSVDIEGIREIAREVRDLIRQSYELDQLEKYLNQVGYAEWVKSGAKERFYTIIRTLNSGAATASEYWKQRHSSHNLR